MKAREKVFSNRFSEHRARERERRIRNVSEENPERGNKQMHCSQFHIFHTHNGLVENYEPNRVLGLSAEC